MEDGRNHLVFVVAGEPSGDQLGGRLMQYLLQLRPSLKFCGVGGAQMEAVSGFNSLFPMTDIAVMGFVPVIKKLPSLLKRINQTVQAVIQSNPGLLIIIDSPDFTHRVAKQVRKIAPHIPIVNYVSPTVWAWRSDRARKMRPYIDHLLAVLPFEPAAHLRLGGPPCTYVGHPLIERLQELQPDEIARSSTSPLVLILPGSRRSEIAKLMPVFGEAITKIHAALPNVRFALPAVPHVRADIMAHIQNWPVKPHIIDGEAQKYAFFREARAAIAASGTVTLELALAQVPMITAYKVSKIEEFIIRGLVTVSSAILPNLILGENIVPEFLQENCTADNLCKALLNIAQDGDMRNTQLQALRHVIELMQIKGKSPSEKAAEITLNSIRDK